MNQAQRKLSRNRWTETNNRNKFVLQLNPLTPLNSERCIALMLVMVIVIAPLHGAFATTLFDEDIHHSASLAEPTIDHARHDASPGPQAMGENHCAQTDMDCCGVCIPVVPGGTTQVGDFGTGVPSEAPPFRFTQTVRHPLLRPPIS